VAEQLGDPIQVRGSLERIMRSEIFARSPQARRFLEFVTEKALEGALAELKAYTIGVAALGVVGERSCPETAARMQASRLRRLLLRYYETIGKEEPFELQLPPGSYVPILVDRRERQSRRSVPPVHGDLAAVHGAPSVRVEVFGCVSEEGREVALSQALSEGVVNALVTLDGLKVTRGRSHSAGYVDFILRGSVTRLDETVRVMAALHRSEDDEAVWSERFDLILNSDVRTQLDFVAESIAAQVGDPVAGAVPMACRECSDFGVGYAAQQTLWRLLRHPTSEALLEARLALEQALPRASSRLHVQAAYAFALSLGPFFGIARAEELKSADVHARAALAEADSVALALLSRAFLAYHERDFGEVERLACEALELSVSGQFVRAVAGNLIMLSGSVDAGRDLIDGAFRRVPRLPRYLQSALCLDALLRRSDPQAALQLAQRIGRETPGWGSVLEASCFIVLGQTSEARRAAARVNAHSGLTPRQLERRLLAGLPRSLAEPLLASSADAGLIPVSEVRPGGKRSVPPRSRSLPNEIRVGILHSLSGPMSMCETHLVNAAMLAIDEINLRGGLLGRPVRALVEDGASSPDVFRRKAEKLLRDDGVSHVFGCWMSSARKALLPVLEAHKALLWYPLQYEGLECSQNVVYTGSSLNQQVEPAVVWANERGMKRCLLVGSDYVYPRTANRLIRGLVESSGGVVEGEFYVPLGRSDSFSEIASVIRERAPDVVFSTINGIDNVAFFKALEAAQVRAEKTPVMSFSLSEIELQSMPGRTSGHYACWSYFQSIGSAENLDLVRRFRGRYGESAVLSDPIVTAYSQVHLFADIVCAAGTVDVGAVWSALIGADMHHVGESLRVRPNHHIERRALIGRARADGQFDLVWRSPALIVPEPWLGVDQANILSRNLVLEALRALPEMAERASHSDSRAAQGWS
jgi:urea ABC transporter urea binding protein